MSAYPTTTDRIRALITAPYFEGDVADDIPVIRWAEARLRRVKLLLQAYDGLPLLDEIETREDFDVLEAGVVRLAEKDGAAPVLTEIAGVL